MGNVKLEIDDLKKKTLEPDFWSNDKNLAIIEKIAKLQEKEKLIAQFNGLTKSEKIDDAKIVLRKIIFNYCFEEKYLKNSAIVNIYSGVGGKDAEDWAGILARMYQKFFENQKFSYKIINSESGSGGLARRSLGEGGYKFFSFEVSGNFPFGILKFEKGVHRLVRISPFSAGKLRHTSFALVDVIPLIEKSEINIKESDLEIQTFRSGGAGGQNVNKVETAVRVVYKLLNLSAVCQSERLQHQNREKALKILSSKIAKIMEEKKIQEIQELKGVKIDIGWSNQKRSYVFHPYQLVKDHEFNYATNKLDAILNGHLELVHPLGAIL